MADKPAFDWLEYMRLAKELRKVKSEACARSAISRSYYSAYNVARTYLRAKQRDWKMKEHDRLWSQVFNVSGQVDLRSWGNRIREKRNKADYDFEYPNLKDEVDEVFIFAEKIITKISTLDHSPDPIVK